jgi:hypothetical protein
MYWELRAISDYKDTSLKEPDINQRKTFIAAAT